MPTPTREEVLAAAWGLVREEGPAGLSMRRLASRLGVSFQVVYSRVGGKGEVVRALHDEAFAELRATWLAHAGRTPPERLLGEVAVLYLRHAVADPVRFALMFGRPIEEFARDEAARRTEWRCFRATWVDATQAWLDVHAPGSPTPVAVRLAWRLWTAVHGIATVHLAGHDSPSGDVEEEVRAAVHLLSASALRAL